MGIGYVTGANDFFHLRPSTAGKLGIDAQYLHAAVRNGRALTEPAVTKARVRQWLHADEPVLLLTLTAGTRVTGAVRRYLDSAAGRQASRILLGRPAGWSASDDEAAREGLIILRSWRHCDS